MKNLLHPIIIACLIFCNFFTCNAQDTLRNKKNGGYYFSVIKDIEATEVQNQSKTGTCWSFSALSFFESELLRMGKGKVNLSEMFIIRNAYLEKAEMYVRMHGSSNFGEGGAFHDIPYVIKKYGIVPEEVYKGLNYGLPQHNHAELGSILTNYLKAVVDEKHGSILTPAWKKGFQATVDSYLGEIPKEFTISGKTYTPKSYSENLGLNMDDYIVLTSFTHHPFYENFVIELPDNWLYKSCFNLPLDELIGALDNALMNGYTWAWAADVSEKGFSFRDGLAIVPEDESTIIKKGIDNKNFNDAGALKVSSAFDAPVKERMIDQKMRQDAFDSWETTDDHGMHVTGIVKDQKGTKYYIVKNSWGTGNDCDGYFYASENYVKYKTTNVILHKNALSGDLKKKLGIK
jgi:bleomycin hydrolase